jgi:type II secretory pathway pseudopilin PulG
MKEPLQFRCRSFLPPALAKAFTRVELLCVVGCIGIIGMLALPLGAHQRRLSSRTEELLCQANLREIGRAYQLWASDHDDLNPFLVETNQGGIKGIPVANNLWYQFAWISNQVRTPKIFVCPADTNTTRVANDFSSNPNGGFLHPNYRNNAISYFLAFHTFPENPRAILAGDRNIAVTSSSGCSYAGLTTVLALQYSFSPVPWDESIHGVQGNLLFNDTSAEMYSINGLNRLLASPVVDSQRIHFLKPR